MYASVEIRSISFYVNYLSHKKRFDLSIEVNYLDWNNALPILNKAHEGGLFSIIIGPKGTGKTTLVRKFASLNKKDLYSVNFSLRTRESHLVGSKDYR